jgi:hypothetical protein
VHSKRKHRDLTGQVFGRLTVVCEIDEPGPIAWKVRCSCGEEKICSTGNLTGGRTNSCGCLKKETCSAIGKQIKHGKYRSPEYSSWQCMRNRCYYPEDKSYPRYGGRGITVHPSWKDNFQAFLDDVGPMPDKGYTLDRIDNDGNYEPGNVKWSTPLQQARNRSTNVILSYNGITKTLREWATDLGIKPSCIYLRHSKGLSPSEILSTTRLKATK